MVLYIIRNRLRANKRNWRVILKTLQLSEYCLLHGSLDFAKYSGNEETLKYYRKLTIFSHVNKKGKDRGVRIRKLASKLMKLLQDETALKEVRAAAYEQKAKLHQKIEGVSHNEVEFEGPYGAAYRMNALTEEKDERFLDQREDSEQKSREERMR